MGNQLTKETTIGQPRPTDASSTTAATVTATAAPKTRTLPKDFVLLKGCSTLEEHEAKIRWALETIRNNHSNWNSNSNSHQQHCLEGEEGLRALGFEYRFVPCRKCAPLYDDNNDDDVVVDDVNVEADYKHANNIPTKEGATANIVVDDDPILGQGSTENSKNIHANSEDVTKRRQSRISWKPSSSSSSSSSLSDNNHISDTNGDIRKKKLLFSKTSFGGSFYYDDQQTAIINNSKGNNYGNEEDKDEEEREHEEEENYIIPNCTSCHDCITRLFYVGVPPSSPTESDDNLSCNNDANGNGNGNGNGGPSKDVVTNTTSASAMTTSTSTSTSTSHLKNGLQSTSELLKNEEQQQQQRLQMQSLDDNVDSNNVTTSPPTKNNDNNDNTSSQLSPSATTTNASPASTSATSTTTTSSSSKPPLFDTAIAIPITPQNRQQYIANGSMYELIASLAQQATHQYMIRTFHLSWVTICNNNNNNDNNKQDPIRALVDEDHGLVYKEGSGRVVLLEKKRSNKKKKNDEIGEEANDEKDDNENHNVIMRDEKKEDCLEEDASSSSSSSTTSQTQPPPTPTTTSTSTSTPKPKPKLTKQKSTFHNRSKKGTLLIATGRGKVRAGIFSRQHLLTTGIEVGSAWHTIREARMRGMGVAIIDPNARGEGVGMETFERSVSRLFLEDHHHHHHRPNENGNCNNSRNNNTKGNNDNTTSSTPQSLYILAHSASGGQLVRHLRQDPKLLPSIRAIAFTDSTHNVQWCKHDPKLTEMLQSKNCVYLRSNEVRSGGGSHVRVSSRGKEIGGACASAAIATASSSAASGATSSSSSSSSSSSLSETSTNHHHYSHHNIHKDQKSAGKPAETDHFWEHRFGKIKTLWAGTAEHSLSNWAGHDQIWDHFDEHATADDEEE